ncbi:hypothetical protein MP638_000966 [Amoeboaphelidium occidentale]|nr:hypothetical protein MP638_000966 [Amoeboaphelidium occidentale]
MNGIMKILLVGVVFHFTYLWSIFDIYFRTPLVHGMTPVKADTEPPAKRLVLFVADGLRADKTFETTPYPPFEEEGQPIDRIPYLRSIVKERGRFGVSHTRVPTESRPGHVAVIAGFYEDVSAVTKGWKMNPVEFDSVFNESRHTWSFGSPDILPMFKLGAKNPDKIETFMYSAEEEDFASKDAKKLDEMTFDFCYGVFNRSLQNDTLMQMLKQDKIVIFLHLLGLDTNGHAHLPNSKEYLENIRYVDEKIKAFVDYLDEFYDHDQKTAYVFTADHGMSDIGNHGDGNPQNTRTPLIAWGAGIAKPQRGFKSGHDEYSKNWNLDDYHRNDVLQADVAPLMSSLIGIEFPMNSVGTLPLEYLSGDDEFKARNLFANAKQILAQYLVKETKKRNVEPFFQEFKPLSNSTHSHDMLLKQIESFLTQKKYIEAQNTSLTLIQLCLEGMRYFQTYDWLFLRSVVSSGYLGWVVYSSVFVLKEFVFKSSVLDGKTNLHNAINFVATIVMCSFALLLRVKEAPLHYNLYVLFPVYFWSCVLKKLHIIQQLVMRISISALLFSVTYIIGLELLVASYFYREILGFIFVILGLLWPILQIKKSFIKNNLSSVASWTITCISSSSFMFLPVHLEENFLLIVIGGLLILTIAVFSLIYIRKDQNSRGTELLVSFQSSLVLGSLLLVISTMSSLRAKEGLPLINQILSWLVLWTSLIVPMVFIRNTSKQIHKLIIVFLMFAPTMIFLTLSYETLFYSSLFLTFLSWLQLESALYNDEHTASSANTPSSKSITRKEEQLTKNSRPLELRDTRIGIFFLFFINCAFFGTGNVASVASFQISSVYRLTTIFSPFFMGGLLTLKILIPFLLLASTFNTISRNLQLPSFSLFLFTLSTTDIMTMNFFFLVRDYGSWLEIGTSISHFVIACLFEVFM